MVVSHNDDDSNGDELVLVCDSQAITERLSPLFDFSLR
jgi:hypothetical protein